MADNRREYQLYFDLLSNKIAQYEVQPSNIYNMDEEGFLIGFLTKAKRIYSRAAAKSGRLLSNVQDGNREWITILAAIYADGTSIAPSLIY
jgi:hypothetical protein